MIIIDGSEGEGGGQMLRYSAALSLLTGEAFTINNIRGKRAKPGIMRQHLTALEAACLIGGAECSGLAVGSSEITFRPGRVTPGNYHFAVGTAGSTGLVLQTVLVPLLLADGPSRLTIEGGTHAMAAPPFEFTQKTLLPIINRMGPNVSARLDRHGFFPRGGGKIEVEINPAPLPTPLQAIECITRGALKRREATALLAGLSFDIGDRELKSAQKFLPDWPSDAFLSRQIPADQGPGNALLIEAEFEHITEIVSGFGKFGLSAERLAKTAAKRMAGYLASNAFAGPYLQDQLLLPFAMAGGGSFTTVRISGHTRTAIRLIERFVGCEINLSEQADSGHLVQIHGGIMSRSV